MKIIQKLKDFLGRIKTGVSRFSIPFGFSVVLFLILAYSIIFEKSDSEIIIPLIFGAGFGLVVSILLKIMSERCRKIAPNFIVQLILSSITAIACFVLTYILKIDNAYVFAAYWGLIISCGCFGFYLLSRGENDQTIFSHTISSIVFTGAICAILSAGISICIAAVQFLIFDFEGDTIWKILAVANLFIWSVVAVNLFLSYIPEKDTKVTAPKVFKMLSLYVGLPLYMLLIAVLFVYLAKIVITLKMPIGEINWFASFAALFFIFFMLSVRQYEERSAQLFTRFGGYLLIPVVIVQGIAIMERVVAYGLTTPRTCSIILVLIGLMFIITSLISQKHLSKVYIAAGIIVLLVTITPLNVISIPKYSQQNILEEVLIKNNMLKDGAIIPNESISQEDKDRILSSYHYLEYAEGKKVDFLKDTENLNTLEIFGFEQKYSDNINKYYTFSCKDSIDISGYNRMVDAYGKSDNMIEVEVDGKKTVIDTKDVFQKLYDKHGKDNNDLDLYIVSDKIALYIKQLSGDISSDNKIEYCYFEGYVLLKN
ncbi:MAG: DUF4153 domain-containing protein [Eubacteriales bacterium]|nr:DUF4153 domain-containing protein [Eubacteriales bacterium]